MKPPFVAAALTVSLALLTAGPAHAAPESWYTYWGVGWAGNSYPGEVEELLDLVEDAGFDKTAVGFDILGFYWPLPDRPGALLGFVMNGAGDRYDRGRDWIQVTSALLGVSSMWFLGPEPGVGFFVRADLGLAWLSLSDSTGYAEDSDTGYGALLGVGYGIPVTEGTRILLNVNWAMKHAGGDDVRSLGLSVGGLF